MKFVRVSKIAEQLNMDVAVVFEMVQKKLLAKGLTWFFKEDFIKYNSRLAECHNSYSGLVILIAEDYVLTYGSEEFCRKTYGGFHPHACIKIKVKDFDIIYNNTVELSGEYTKEQLQQILNEMEE